jgi:hypothetical protein
MADGEWWRECAMFAFLGVIVGIYTAWAACSGSVYARRGAWGAMVLRDESPFQFWSVIVCYALLSIAMMVIF